MSASSTGLLEVSACLVPIARESSCEQIDYPFRKLGQLLYMTPTQNVMLHC